MKDEEDSSSPSSLPFILPFRPSSVILPVLAPSGSFFRPSSFRPSSFRPSSFILHPSSPDYNRPMPLTRSGHRVQERR
ncbi:MAG: hypothetical protein ACXW5U_20310 [Thermoanaerobaculia bacterium]